MLVLPSYRYQSIDLLCFANQLTGFHMRATLVFNGLRISLVKVKGEKICSYLWIFSHFIKKIFNGKLHFLFIVIYGLHACIPIYIPYRECGMREGGSALSKKSKQKQPPKCVFRKRYSENMQQIYWRATMPKYDFHK